MPAMQIDPNLFASQATPLLRLNERPWKIFYRGLVPKPLRNRINGYASRRQMYHTAALWRPFLRAYFRGELSRFDLLPKQKLGTEKIIWQYWGQGLDDAGLPEVVRLCFRSVERHLDGYRLIRLDDSNWQDYLDLPDFVVEKRRHPAFKPAFFADLLRLALLDVYGGVWLDASVFMTAPLPKEWAEWDFFMFQRSPDAADQAFWHAFNADVFDWTPNHPVQVNNCMIAAKQGNPLIHACLDVMLNFWQTQNHIPHYFFFQIMFGELCRHYFPDASGIKIDDTLPHLLLAKLNQPYNADTFATITARTPVHKLDRRLSLRPGSYGAYLKQLTDTQP